MSRRTKPRRTETPTPDTPGSVGASPEPEAPAMTTADDILAQQSTPTDTPVADPEAAKEAARRALDFDGVMAGAASPAFPGMEPEPVIGPLNEPARRGPGRPRGSRNKRTDEPEPAPRTRGSKAELAARIAELERENAMLRPEGQQEVAKLAGALSMTFKMLSAALAKFRGPHWAFSDDESRDLGEAWAEPLAPYMAQSSEYLAFASAAAITYATVQPRLQRDRELAGAEPVTITASGGEVRER